MSGKGRLHGYLSGFGIPHLTDHDDVRILPKDGTKRARKGQADLAVNRNLIDAMQLIFDGVLDGDYLEGIRIHVGE